MMKANPNKPTGAGQRCPMHYVAFLDLLRRRPIAGAERVGAPSGVRRRAYARAMAEIRSYVVPSGAGGVEELATHRSLRDDVDAGARR